MPDVSPHALEIDALRTLLAECLRRIDDLERQLGAAHAPVGDGSVQTGAVHQESLQEPEVASPGPFRIREISLSEPSSALLQPAASEPDRPEAPDPFAFLNVSPIAHSEGAGLYHGVRALLGGLAITRPSGSR